MKRVFITAFFLSAIVARSNETKLTSEDYINQWKITAIEQMNMHGIPASITLAQGILESGNGNSRLAKEANNHFGIKCHKGWDGNTFFQDDDKANECFRSYDNASQSYEDHSQFLTSRSRYSGLFELKMTDYKGWAKGLKSAGYATNPKYANLLIDIIEKFDLHEYDLMPYLPAEIKEEEKIMVSVVEVPTNSNPTEIKDLKSENQGNSRLAHTVYEHKNGIRYVMVKEGDTYYQIAKEFNLGMWQLYKYNDLGKRDVLKVGEIIYLDPKKNRAKKAYNFLEVKNETTYRDVSQKEGIKLKKLLKLNGVTNPDGIIPAGTKVILR